MRYIETHAYGINSGKLDMLLSLQREDLPKITKASTRF